MLNLMCSGFVLPFCVRGKGYNLGSVKHGPKKENQNIYLQYEDGDDCGGGKNYSSRILMQCGSKEVINLLS